ncbi:hypothetical protein [Agromyces mariniharenae]|uniref:Uncharacterized protein n=1 Tax=Agromyces mariniharenae TaxID=2604423 RepID=A0A5S4V4Q9_9MICO|nr:hypothetical protein [Agromyces mariniharenae]TYL53168.1 hypothetical protein FYC51_05570 [Agromyces mariniharenae]
MGAHDGTTPAETAPPTKEELERLTAAEALAKAISDRQIAEGKAADDRETARLAHLKSQSEAEEAKATAELALETTRLAQQKSKLDNESTRLANEQKVREGKQAEYDALAAKVAAAVPKLSQIPVNTITVPDGYAFRESENVGHVLDKTAEALVADLRASGQLNVNEFPKIVITSNPKLAESAIAFYAMKAEFNTLVGQADAVREDAEKLLEAKIPEKTKLTIPGVGDIIASGAAAAAQAVTEVAGLFQTDTALTNVVSEPAEFTVHARIARRLIGSINGIIVASDQISPVAEDSPLLASLQELLTAYDKLADTAIALQSKFDSTSDDEANLQTRAALASMKTRVAALRTRIEALVARVTTVPVGNNLAPLTEAIILSTSAIADAKTSVLIVPPAKAYTDQVVVKRRIFSPRVSVSTYLELPFVLLQTGQVKWAGTSAARTGYTALFKRGEVKVVELKKFSFQVAPDAAASPATN